MCKVQMLRALVEQRLTAAAEEIFGLFERTIAEYEEELCRSKEENERQRELLDAVFNPQLRVHRADVQQLSVFKEDVPPEQQECSASVDQQQPEAPPHIKEEQEELLSSQEGEQLQGLEEADITKFPLTPVPVKNDEKEAQSSQLHQRPTQHIETEADGEDCGGPEPGRNSHLLVQPGSEDQTGDSSETDDSTDWKETREPQSALNSLKHDSRCKKKFSCSECGRRFGTRGHLYDHMRIHPGEKKYSCSVCNKRFIWRQQVRRHKCVNLELSQLHQSQTEKNREAEPPARRETQHMETEADGEDCGRPEPARNSHSLLQPETEDRTGDSAEPETDESADWKETREPQSALNSLKHDSRCKKKFSCSECGRRFGTRGHLYDHMRIHPGEKKYSCSVCNKRFIWRQQVRRHKCVNLQSSQLHHSQTEENREADPPARRETQHMENKANGEDCGGPDPARNSHPLLQPETEDQSGDSSEPEADDSADWKETRKPQSALKFLKNEDVPVGDERSSAGEKSFICSDCGKRFGNQAYLSIHIRIHTLEKPFSCSVCQKSFSQKHNLQKHMVSHTVKKKHSCSVCGQKFMYKGHVNSHMKSHTGETSFNYSFTDRHTPLRSRTGEKTVSCSFCGDIFSNRSNLSQHMVVHMREKRFSCSVCEERFSLQSEMETHKCAGCQSSQRH